MALAGLDALPRGDTRTRRSGGFWRARWWIAPSAALSGPLVDTVARDVTRYTLLERVVDELGAWRRPRAGPAARGGDGRTAAVIDRLLADGVADRIADRLLDGPELESVAARLSDSRLLDTIVERLLESEELWRLVDEIARSRL